MYTRFQAIRASLLTVLLALTLVAAALAASGFSDVSVDTPLYESVTCLAESGIVNGTGDGRFSPDAPITVRQWAALLCRAFGNAQSEAVTQAYRQGWLPLTCVLAPEGELCRAALYESAFAAAGLSVYDWSLYPGGTPLPDGENCLRLGAELGLCPEGADPLGIVTRGEAALLLHAILTQDLQVEPPPILDSFPLEAPEGTDLNDYLLELVRVPEPIWERFQAEGWVYTVDHQHLAELSHTYHTSCTGATDCGARRIYVSAASSTLHEFGHFLDWALDFPNEHEALFAEEAGAAAVFLRDYAMASSREYFAEYFAYFIRYGESAEKTARMELLTPRTYGYFRQLAENDWR